MGKGAFSYNAPGSKCMSSKRRLLVAQGKMKSSHSCVPHTAENTTNVNLSTPGVHRIGENVRNFRPCFSQQSGVKNDTKHASQPKKGD